MAMTLVTMQALDGLLARAGSVVATPTLLVSEVLGLVQLAVADPAINRSFPGSEKVGEVLGGMKFLALSGCLAALFLGGGAWGLATMQGNGSGWGRRFAFGGAVGALVVGLGADIVNFFYT